MTYYSSFIVIIIVIILLFFYIYLKEKKVNISACDTLEFNMDGNVK